MFHFILYTQTNTQAKHAAGDNKTWGIDGEKGVIADMEELGIWDPLSVKEQTLKSSIEVRCCYGDDLLPRRLLPR